MNFIANINSHSVMIAKKAPTNLDRRHSGSAEATVTTEKIEKILPSCIYYNEQIIFTVLAECDKAVKMLSGVRLSTNNDSAPSELKCGTLYLTTHRLLFEETTDAHFEIPINLIADTSDTRSTLKHDTRELHVSCKNFEFIRFTFTRGTVSVFETLCSRLQEQILDKEPRYMIAASLPDTRTRSYSVESEFDRLQFKPSYGATLKNGGGFRITSINAYYKFCTSYPNNFIVPSAISDGELRKIAQFRANQRIPAVVYRHTNKSLLVRCAQPLPGLRRRRCISDEAYMEAIRTESNGKLLFIDCRSQTSAYGNTAMGGGFENVDHYKNCDVLFLGIENIHSMRDSIRRLYDLIQIELEGKARANWWSCIESTRWLEHVESLLVSTFKCVSKMIDEETSLIVHCSDGWDRTSQIVSLIKLSLDPYFRTLEGFQCLIQQEWCSFGHPFRSRCGLDRRKRYWDDENTSPVFMQFFDAVWQLMRQFPCSFEFNERFLIAILDEVYAKRSVTFSFDTEETRRQVPASQRLQAWEVLPVLCAKEISINPFYSNPTFTSDINRSPPTLRFRWHTSAFALWSSLYLRSFGEHHLRDVWAQELKRTQEAEHQKLMEVRQELQAQVARNSGLHEQLQALRRKSDQLEEELHLKEMSNRKNFDKDIEVIDPLHGKVVHQNSDEGFSVSLDGEFEIISSYFDA